MQVRYPVAPDDTPLFIVRRDISGGINSRQGENIIQENQSTVLNNVTLDTAGERSLRTGATILASLATTAGTGLGALMPETGTNYLIANYGKGLKWGQGAAFSSIASLASTYDFSKSMNMIPALELDLGDVIILTNDTNNAIRLDPVVPAFQDCGNSYTSIPKTNVATYFRDRLWALSNNRLYYSGAIPSDYSNTFNATLNYYNVPVGNERALVGTRDYGLVIFGDTNIYQFNPSAVPAATDKPEFVLEYGCASGNTVASVGDDIVYLSYTGVRALKRTIQDKLQSVQTFPLSYPLKLETDKINWGSISKTCAVYFDNKYILSLPVNSSTYNNQLWVYYPALNAWTVITGLNIARLAVIKFSSEERLYGIDSQNSNVYRLFYGTSDNGAVIPYIEEGRGEDFGQPMKYKYGGELKIRVKGAGATISASADADGTGYKDLDGDSITIPPLTGMSFPLSFPFSFGTSSDITGIWHLDGIGKFKNIKIKIYCNTKDAQLKILESIATTFLDEYQQEDA